jgi:hypothetical protein
LRQRRTWKSRLIDYSIHVAIGLSLVSLIWLMAARDVDTDLGAQLLTAFFGAVVLAVYIVQSCWGRHRHGALLAYSLAVVGIHAVVFVLVFRVAGRTNAWLAGGVIVFELAVFSELAERVVPIRRH